MADQDKEWDLGNKSPGQIICRQLSGLPEQCGDTGFSRGLCNRLESFSRPQCNRKGSVLVARIVNNLSWSAS